MFISHIILHIHAVPNVCIIFSRFKCAFLSEKYIDFRVILDICYYAGNGGITGLWAANALKLMISKNEAVLLEALNEAFKYRLIPAVPVLIFRVAHDRTKSSWHGRHVVFRAPHIKTHYLQSSQQTFLFPTYI